jgi:hypothetical protein
MLLAGTDSSRGGPPRAIDDTGGYANLLVELFRRSLQDA